MKSKAFMILSSVLVLLALGAIPGTRTPNQWEYGIYVDSASGYDWQDASRRVQATNPADFIKKMGFPTGIDVDIRTVRVPMLVLNFLGDQGWELIAVSEASARQDIYWFKRPG